MTEVAFSLIVPTRERPDQMVRFLDSVRTNATRPESIEVIMVVDEDDPSSRAIAYDGLNTKIVVVPPGLAMGALNMAGYRVSRGRYIMLLNDDVVARTSGWDEKILAVFRQFSDEIILAHTNDLIFQEKLCTFPLVSRRFCDLAGGICSEDYVRYRIDDEIYNVFNLLAVLGHKRIVYLPDIVFEHQNFVTKSTGDIEYVPNPEIHGHDTEIFDRRLAERKETAIRLARCIDDYRTSAVDDTRRKILAPIADSVSLRRPEFVRTLTPGHPASRDIRVTVGVVSADLNSDHAHICIDLLKKHTDNFDLVLLDNNHGSDFNHSREMNRLIGMCRTDYLVLMDDDVWVTNGWLDEMLSCMAPEVGVVTPVHLGRDGELSYAGVVLRPDWSGYHSHIFAQPKVSTPTETLCSAVMLIDMHKLGHLRVDESYSKYFMDIDYGMRVWEAGYRVMVAAGSVCTHLGGATLEHGSARSVELFETQRQHWVRDWIATGRLDRLRAATWGGVPELRDLLAFTQRAESLLARETAESIDAFIERALSVMGMAIATPALADWVKERVERVTGGKFVSIHDEAAGHLMILNGLCGVPTLIGTDWHGYDIYLMRDGFFSVVAGHRTPSPWHLVSGEVAGFSRTSSLAGMRERLARGLRPPREVISRKPQRGQDHSGVDRSGTELVVEGYLGYNIIRSGRYYGLLQSDGGFDIGRVLGNSYTDLIVGDSVEEVTERIRQSRVKRLPRRVVSLGRRIAGRAVRRLQRAVGGTKNPAETSLASSGVRPTARNLPDDGTTQRQAIATKPIRLKGVHDGFRVVLYEHKYFCIPVHELQTGCGEIDVERLHASGYSGLMIGHSLAEAHDLIARAVQTAADSNEEILFFGALAAERAGEIFARAGRAPNSHPVLVGGLDRGSWNGNAVVCGSPTLREWAREQKPLPGGLARRKFGKVVVPWSFPESWTGNAVEAAAARIAERVEIVTDSGLSRVYWGENLHRIVYNKAYLSSMFQVVPPPAGLDVLEVGCSDGLVCDLIAACGARQVVGIDVMKTAGCGFPGPNIRYLPMDAAHMEFADESFDLVFSIATLEHVRNPAAVLAEVWRVTKRGGYAYVQAGPLYHSPFGHHMFAYFQEFPWIHLRHSTDEIIAFAEKNQISSMIERDTGQSAETYIRGMLTREHVNGLFLSEYGLQEFQARPDVQVLKFNISHEGSELITQKVLSELAPLTRNELTEHGFELAFRKL